MMHLISAEKIEAYTVSSALQTTDSQHKLIFLQVKEKE